MTMKGLSSGGSVGSREWDGICDMWQQGRSCSAAECWDLGPAATGCLRGRLARNAQSGQGDGKEQTAGNRMLT